MQQKKSRKIRIADVTDCQAGVFSSVQGGLEYNLVDSLGSGQTFTPKACAELIFQKLPDYKDKTQTMACEFSKAALLIILQQEGCEGIRFTFCRAIADNTVLASESLVAFGLTSDGSAIGAEHYLIGGKAAANVPMPVALEKGNKLTVEDIEKFLGVKMENMKPIDFQNFFSKPLTNL